MKFNIKDIFWPLTKKRKYLGYSLAHYRNDSLMDEIKKARSNIYEGPETNAIVGHLEGSPNPTFLDIGANIGLMMLNIAHFIPNATIFAIEPGPLQFRLLKENVESNNLSGRVYLDNIALSNTTGKLGFKSHGHQHSSGDGLVDTTRAGSYSTLEVDAKTLDAWWTAHNKPMVDVMKMDTEGAELLILAGGKEMIQSCKPIIVMEICHLNYIHYGFGTGDFINSVRSLHYAIYDLDSNPVPFDQLEGHSKNHFSYLLKYDQADNQ